MNALKIFGIVFVLFLTLPFAFAQYCDANNTTQCMNVTFVNSALTEKTDDSIYLFFTILIGLALIGLGFYVNNPALEVAGSVWFLINSVNLVISTNYATAIFYLLIGIAVLFQTIINLREKKE